MFSGTAQICQFFLSVLSVFLCVWLWWTKLRKLWDSLSELRNSLCERRLERTNSGACVIACQNCAVYSVFLSGMASLSKIAQFNWECIAPLRCGFAAARSLGLRVRIPAGTMMTLSCEYCMLSGRSLCDVLITRPEESYRLWCVWVWSWSRDYEEALAQYGPSRDGGGRGEGTMKYNEPELQSVWLTLRRQNFILNFSTPCI